METNNEPVRWGGSHGFGQKGASYRERPLKVLLVEDDEDDFIVIRHFLSEIPVSVLEAELDWAAAYEAGIQRYRSCRYDICLLDYRLGEHTGLEFLREVDGKSCGAPIIILTGQGDYEVDLEAMRAGAADYLVKARLSAPLLERAIRYALDHAQAQQELLAARAELEQRVRERTSELAAANVELRKTSEKIKLFAYSVSHDLKSPVLSIHALAQRLQDRFGEALGSKGKEYCDQILGASRQIVSVIEKTNLYISVKEAPLVLENVRLKDLLRVIHAEFSPQLNSRGIKWCEPEEDPLILVDTVSILRVFRNLVDNALKYGGEALSEIAIGYKEEREHHILSVKDDGVGIEGEDSKGIFGLFKRRKSSRGIEGAGLGLAIVKEIAEQHKGKAWMEHGRRKGTVFHMSIAKVL